ncbi:MAG: radical SAM protein [Nitrospirae bacterium]|nr:radical SAM protein [Nitrospirota bacterium]
MQIPSLNFITIQTTLNCNLRCNYCYHDDNNLSSNNKIDLIMSKEIIEKIVSYRKHNDMNGAINITFHGGEPLLLGHKYYDKLLSYITKLSAVENQSFDIAIQTNLTLLDEEYAILFSEHSVSLSTSIDGPKNLHNKNRATPGKDIHSIVLNNVSLARAHGLKLGAICIITKDKLNYVNEIYDFFSEINMNFKTNPIFYHGRALKNRETLETTIDEYTDFLIKLFDTWYYDKNQEVMVENLFQMMTLVLKGSGYGSCYNSNCSTKHLTIVPNGDCYTCGRTTTNDLFKLGNISSENFQDIYDLGRFDKFIRRVPGNIPDCSICDIKLKCFSGCMYEAFLNFGTIYAPDNNCNGFKKIYQHVYNAVKLDIDALTNRRNIHGEY